MFNNELDIARRLDELTGDLSDVAYEVYGNVQDLETTFDFYTEADMVEPDNVDHMVGDLLFDEKEAQRNLAKFDKILNRIIRERRKLGGFIINPE